MINKIPEWLTSTANTHFAVPYIDIKLYLCLYAKIMNI